MKKKLRFIGKFRNTERGYGFIEFENKEQEDVFVAPKMTRNALNGDKVEFIIINPSSSRKESRR